MKYTFSSSLFLLSLIPLAAQPIGNKNEDGFQVSTVTSFMTTKYQWEPKEKKTEKTQPVENHTPLKSKTQKQDELEAVRANGESSQFTGEDMALSEVTLREFTVNEFYSPLLRMGEMKDIEILEPESAPGILKDKYFSDFENNVLNRWTLPLIGRSQEQLARERYRAEKEKIVLGKAGKIAGLMFSWDPEKARELQKDIYEVHFQSAWDYPESRIKEP